MKLYLKILLLLSVFVAPVKGHCSTVNVENVSGDKYFLLVKDALLRAEKSVYVMMPVIEYPYFKNSKVNQLVNALIVARERGVDVEVILDQTAKRVKTADGSEWRTTGRSVKAYTRFISTGVQVHFDDPRQSMNAATIIIDNKRVILGSTNWIEAAIDKSIETNVLVDSGELADNLTGYFRTIRIDPGIDAYIELIGPAVMLPGDILENPRIVPRMIRNHDEQVFDTYLFLLQRFDGNSAGDVVFTYEELAKYLGIYNGRKEKAYRNQIGKVLRKLERGYDLIRTVPADDKTAAVTLIQQGESGTVYAIPQEYAYGLPVAYFENGWNKILSFREKVCYLINLYCSAVSENKPRWSKSVVSTARQFGSISAGIVNKGMNELQRRQLISITYDAANGRYNLRKPRVYELLPLYDPAAKSAACPAALEKRK